MRQTLDNLILVGMPGCGKSTLGVLFAKAQTYAFCDTDLLIQQKEKLPLFKIIEKRGIEGFLQLESEVISNLSGYHRTVIATGGSAVLSEKAMQNLRRQGTVMYIKLEADEIVRRVHNIRTRGIAMKSGETLLDVYNERTPLYEKYADIVVDCTGFQTEESLEAMIAALKEARKTK